MNAAGDVYLTDDDHHVAKLAAGSNAQTVLPFTGVDSHFRVAVDVAGNAHVAEGRQVVELEPGSNAQTVLPITGLNDPLGLAVDKAGNVYVLDDSGFGRVVKLAAG